MAKINVLVFPAGEINSIELHDALSTCVNIELYGASSINRHGEYVFKNYISNVPMINACDFFEKFNELLGKYNIDVIFPTHDTVAMFFAQNSDKINAKIIAADKNTAEICRDKEKTYEVLQGEEFLPKVYKKIESYPVFIKPKEGQGSVGAKLLKSEEDIPNVDLDEYVICEYLPGEEYTVDCFTDFQGALKVVSPRSRRRLLAGVCVSGKTEKLTDDIKQIATKINSKLKFNGLWWFQIKKDVSGNWKLLEVSTRCAGTMCLTRARGLNLPLMSVYNALGYEVKSFANDIEITMDRTLISRYKTDYKYDTVYFDFDDTLIINDKVHLPAVRFLYQCRNLGKYVVLLTKHEKDIYETLEKYAISQKLFSEIILISPNDEKSNYIKNSVTSIFVDNAYQERAKVHNKFKIPVFDVDGLEVLLDWRS